MVVKLKFPVPSFQFKVKSKTPGQFNCKCGNCKLNFELATGNWKLRLLPMALGATIYNFDIELADSDRHVYETLALRVACHPSESEEYLVTRVLAYLLEFADGIEFSRGVSDPDEPTIAVRDLTGAVVSWIDIGTPDAARLHRASKASARVAVYTHKEPTQFLKQLAGAK